MNVMMSAKQNDRITKVGQGTPAGKLLRSCRQPVALATLTIAILASTIPVDACAQSIYPAKPVVIVVPFPGGGALDSPTRVLAEKLSERLGKAFVVENVSGASGNIGTERVARSAPDGYTLLMGAAPNTSINKFLYAKLPFDSDRDFVPIAQFAVSTNVIYVNPSFPASTLKDLVAELRRQPGKFDYASPGSGTSPHLAMELLKARQKVFVVHIPFRGSPPAVTAVAGGQLQLGVDAVIAVAPLVRSGRLRALAVTSESRISALPEVPTTSEAGIPGIEISSYLGLFAPTGTPKGILATLSAEIAQIMQINDVVVRIRRSGVEPQFLAASAFVQRIQKDRELFREAVKFSGAAID